MSFAAPPDHEIGAVPAAGGCDGDAALADRHVDGSRALVDRPGANSRGQERPVELVAARDDEAMAIEGHGDVAATMALRIEMSTRHESGGPDRDGVHAARIDHVLGKCEGASRDAAAARLLTRVRRIEQHNPRSTPREIVCGTRAGRPCADDGDVCFHGI